MTPPLLGFPPESFQQRRDRVKAALDGGVLLLPAAPILRRSRDTEHRYRPDSELFYLTGCVDPGIVAVLRDSDEDSFVLFVPEWDPKAETWFGPRMLPEEAGERTGADAVYTMVEMEDRLDEILRQHHQVFFRLGGDHPKIESLVLRALEWGRTKGQRTGTGPRSIVDPGQVLDELRLVKSSEEVSRLRQATSLTVAAFRDAMAGTRPGMGEWEVEALFESGLRGRGARGPAFPTIVGSGKNGCILHYVENRDLIREGDLVLLDGGAEVDLYAGDLTRTFPAGGSFSDPQADVYGLVLKAHQAAIAQVRPGSTVGEIHDAVVRELLEGLLAFGVIEGDPEELREEKAYEPFYPHQTSHWTGLDVHDVGDYSGINGSRVLEPGMVLTVEPGLYFGLNSGAVGSPFRGIGVRIEDDLLVTEEGVENLSADLPVEPAEIEELVGARFKDRSTS